MITLSNSIFEDDNVNKLKEGQHKKEETNMLNLYKVNKWWNNLEKHKKVKICLNYSSHSINDDYREQFDWWYYLPDWKKVEVYKNNKDEY